MWTMLLCLVFLLLFLVMFPHHSALMILLKHPFSCLLVFLFFAAWFPMVWIDVSWPRSNQAHTTALCLFCQVLVLVLVCCAMLGLLVR